MDDKAPNVLVVEDEVERQVWFAVKFRGQNISWARDADTAISFLKDKKFNIICLDYDLKHGSKGRKVAEFLADDKNNKNAIVIIHSLNKEGALEMSLILRSYECHIKPFYELVKEL